MYVSARTDYAMRAMLAVAARHPEIVKAATLAASQDIPPPFLRNILLDLRRAGLLHSLRGADGGYCLTRGPEEVTVGDVLRATNGAITTVRGLSVDAAIYQGVAAGLGEFWGAVHRSVADIVDNVTLADLLGASHEQPSSLAISFCAETRQRRLGSP
ncbi:Rrf2 family transcriptional regulator [Micromonospora sp. NPDC048909]|uniref:RrF2 family transcriptional regulator n=1 Tax=Micromonospora sp. NPDC048909 TaxID=3155643 RepID=UPI0033E2DDC8